jgi:hypothetical protein
MLRTDAVTHKFWCSQFMSGIHKQVRQVWKPDRVMTINIIHAADKVLEVEWDNSRRDIEQKQIAKMGAWFIQGFCNGLCGEEMLLIKLAGTANSLSHLLDAKNTHFVFVILGRTKGDQTLGAKLGGPCAPITHETHLCPGQGFSGYLKPFMGPGISLVDFSIAV